jgi:quinol monooxygenase YgiN
MLIIMGTVRFPADKIKEAKSVMEAMIKGSRAEVGCITYNLAQDLLDPGLIHVSEAWESQEALAGHSQTEHMKAWRTAGAGLGIGERNIKLYEASVLKVL